MHGIRTHRRGRHLRAPHIFDHARGKVRNAPEGRNHKERAILERRTREQRKKRRAQDRHLFGHDLRVGQMPIHAKTARHKSCPARIGRSRADTHIEPKRRERLRRINARRHLHHLIGIRERIGNIEHRRSAAPVRAKREARPNVLLGDRIPNRRADGHRVVDERLQRRRMRRPARIHRRHPQPQVVAKSHGHRHDRHELARIAEHDDAPRAVEKAGRSLRRRLACLVEEHPADRLGPERRKHAGCARKRRRNHRHEHRKQRPERFRPPLRSRQHAALEIGPDGFEA